LIVHPPSPPFNEILFFSYELNRKLLTNKIVAMAAAKNIKPTESELEILRVLWDKGTATVREVHEILAEHKDAGYTTTLKLMQIMFEKGIVKRDDSSKTHIYRPISPARIHSSRSWVK
jgi:Fe2+ or Zn2+ uptake regulation protein